jgi:hypothetical protein
MATALLKHEDDVSRVRDKRSKQFSLKIKRNVYLVFDTSKGLVLGHMAVVTQVGNPSAASSKRRLRARWMVLSGGRKRRLSRSVLSVAPVVGTKEIRDI